MSSKKNKKGKVKDVCTRNWNITIQNPKDIGLEHEEIKKILLKSRNKVKFAAMVDEIAPTTGTYHTHLVVIFTNPIRRSTITGDKWFKKSHCEGTYEEIGTRPIFKEKKEPKEKLTDVILKYVEDGLSTAEMIEKDSRLINKIREIELTRQIVMSKKYMIEQREINVIYLEGKPATGKSTYVFEHHNPETICRITNYSPTRGVLFDNFESGKHDVLVFEDWNSNSTPICRI